MMSLRPPAKKIQEHFTAAEKKKLLVDVDGSLIQTFVADGKEINVYDDYDVGAVYIESAICLDLLF